MKKLIFTVIMFSFLSSALAFMHMRIYVVPAFGGCNGKIYMQECGLNGNPYALMFDGNNILFDDASLLSVCSGSHTLSFTSTQGLDTYHFSATINLNGNSSSVVYSASPTVEPMTCVVNYYASANCDGSITLNVTGGYSPLNYAWFLNGSTYTGAFGNNATNLCPGNYGFSVTDNSPFACNVGMGLPYIPIEIESVACALNITNVSCNGSCDGEAEIIIMTNPMNITSALVSGPDNMMYPNITSGQCAGNALGFITHITGTMAYCPGIITEPNILVVDLSIDQPTTAGGTASITATVTGGTPNYQYDWSGVLTNDPTHSTVAGTYTVSVIDQEGCSSGVNYTIYDPLAMNITSVQHQTETPPNGMITYTISGGLPPYITYLDNAGTLVSSNYTNLLAGDYTAVVEDNDGNSIEVDFTIGNALSIENQQSIEFTMYPNPVNDVLFISSIEEFSYSIITITGQVLDRSEAISSSFTIDAKNWTNGIYFIECRYENGLILTRRFIRD
jgi:hypothetical protein